MNPLRSHNSSRLTGLLVFLTTIGLAVAQTAQPPHPREFRSDSLTRLDQLPKSRFRTQLEALPPLAQERARAWLRGLHFTEDDLNSLHADREGGIYFACGLQGQARAAAEEEPVTSDAAVPADPFPEGLYFHSRPGSPNVLYLNFSGETVTNTQWNTVSNRPVFDAVAFSKDSDYANFSDAEQVAIKRIWERVSEDYAPFDIDVTTERPAVFDRRTAHALITRSTDANNLPNPSSSAGGVAYVNVFNSSSYASRRPAWIYSDHLGAGDESFIAEAVSHEIGHNLGLSHDGTSGSEYYGGHGTGDTSWGPIMGTGYNRNVSQWCKGEYYLANNTQDDLSTIAGKLSYRTDDVGDTPGTAQAILLTGGTNVLVTTPETDSANTDPSNKGVLERNTDVDVFSFVTGDGPVSLSVQPWLMPAGSRTRGGNLDVLLELRSEAGALLMTNNPPSLTTASIATNLSQGLYYLYIKNSGAGAPLSSSPTGYASYGSIGQYFISGYIQDASGYVDPTNAPAMVELNLAATPSAWGNVSPANGSYLQGTNLQLVATPVAYYRFTQWTGDVSGTNNPMSVTLTSDLTTQAVFAEELTTNFPTPYWWLAANGYTNNFETAVTDIGANGMPVWQSYVAGLDPANPASQLLLSGTPVEGGTGFALHWNTVTGRTYSIWFSTSAGSNYTVLRAASNLSWTVRGFTNAIDPATPGQFYRLEVQKP